MQNFVNHGATSGIYRVYYKPPILRYLGVGTYVNVKQNYRPLSTLANLSVVFGKLIYSQIDTYISDKFAKYLTGFCKSHNTQHALLSIIEKWKSNLNKGSKIRTIFMNLSNAFDTLHYSLLIAKLGAYGQTESRDNSYIRCPARSHTWTLVF